MPLSRWWGKPDTQWSLGHHAMKKDNSDGMTVISLLLVLLFTYSGESGFNINTTINAPVTVIQSK